MIARARHGMAIAISLQHFRSNEDRFFCILEVRVDQMGLAYDRYKRTQI